MATADTTLQILIKATDQTGDTLTSVGSRLSGLADGARTVSQPFAGLATAVAKVDAALVAMVGGGLALAVNESGKFGDAFSEITTLFDAAPADIEQFRSDILAYAQDSQKSIDQINGAVYSAISAGADYTQSLGLVRQAELTSIAGKASLNDATVLLASSLNAYGEEMDRAADYSDALFVAVRDGQTTLPELSSSLAQVTGVAAQSGVSFDDLLAAVATLTASGLPTSQAVTAIKGALTNILKPSQDAQKTAAKLGLEFGATALASKGLGGFMGELKDKTGGNIDAMSSLFGSVEGLNGALILTGTGAQKFSGVLEDMQHKAGATTTAYEKMATDFGAINQQLANNVKADLVLIGDQIQGDYKDLIGALTEVFQSLGTAAQSGAFDDVFSAIEQALNRAETALQNLAKNLPEALGQVDFSGLVGSAEALGGAFGDLFGGLDLSTADGVAKATQTVVDSLQSLVDLSKGIVDGLQPFFTALETAVDKFNALDDGSKTALGGLTGFMTGINLLTGPLGSLGDGLSAVGNGLSAMAGAKLAQTVAGLAGPGGLSAALSAAASAGSKLLGVLTGPVGLAAAAVGSGYEVYRLVEEVGKWKDATAEAIDAQERAAISAAALTEKYQQISEATGVSIRNSQEFHAAIDAGKIVFDEATKSWVKATRETTNWAEAQIEARRQAGDTSSAWEAMAAEQGKLVGAMEAATAATGKNASAMKKATDELAAYYVAQGNSEQVARLMAEAETRRGKATAEAAQKVDDATAASEEYRLKLLELASDERIKTMEFTAEIKTAQIEADAERVKAVFASIDGAIESTGQLLGDLAGQFTEANNFHDKWKLEKLLDNEAKNRDKVLGLQEKQITQELEIGKAKLKRLRSGDALITVSGDGLEPELQAFMWKILEAVQVKGSEDYSEFLLGV